MDFNAVSTSFHYAIQNYAYNLRPSYTGIESRMAEHFHYLDARNYAALRDATYRAADALREYVDARQSMSDYAREYGDTSGLEALWRVAEHRETEVHALIACAMDYEYDYDNEDIIGA